MPPCGASRSNCLPRIGTGFVCLRWRGAHAVRGGWLGRPNSWQLPPVVHPRPSHARTHSRLTAVAAQADRG